MSKHYTSVISNLFGKFAHTEFPSIIQHTVNAGYVKLMGLDMSEFREPARYATLNKLFTRALEKPRKIPEGKSKMISSVDARVTDCGTVTGGKAYQIKGMEYGLEELFGTYHREAVEKVEGGTFMNFYLSPKDYHRYHIPMDLKVLSATHIPGKLYPVNFPLLRNKKDLFIENERVVIECLDRKKRTHVLVLVGALNVGKMVLLFEKNIRTNSDIREPQHYTYDDLWLERGELFGWFEMGSTLLIFSKKGSIVPEIAVNQKVKFTDVIAKIK
ncbi:phosphatidylserine decarboxylase [Sulfurovum sp.]|uniref:phosphatidylserine decarboxylase n=1 Tax=Sulfurovum sp. TaxID=1969726 RepID=UPI0025E847F2|nr:phosphatidylserine decarboxylase [Sulfurovum sp.]